VYSLAVNLLVTGGAGFIGSCYVRLCRQRRPGSTIVNLDALTYAGNLESLADLRQDKGHVFVKGDIRDGALVRRLIEEHRLEAVVHFAAESHVDRSIMSAEPFVDTNVLGTLRLLEAARAAGVRRFVQVSTDEVYGSLGPEGAFHEQSPITPRSPYSASKAAADHLVQAFHHTHGLDVVITRCSNNYGPYQFPEKLIPLMIINALGDKSLPVYGDGLNVREWLHVEDHCAALALLLKGGRAGHVYNIGSNDELGNLHVVRRLLQILGKPETLIRFVQDRPGHDRRYAIDSSKLRSELGWQPRHDFTTGLEATVTWYLDNQSWWRRVTSGEYTTYYDSQYRERLQREPAVGGAAP
jgi:dTDP-glucose 4,6-dehydratase